MVLEVAPAPGWIAVVATGGLDVVSEEIPQGDPVEAHVQVDEIDVSGAQRVQGGGAALHLGVPGARHEPAEGLQVLVPVLHDEHPRGLAAHASSSGWVRSKVITNALVQGGDPWITSMVPS